MCFVLVYALSLIPCSAFALQQARGRVELGPDEPGSLLQALEINSETGGFLDALDAGDQLGAAAAALGDLDLDGVPDLALGAPGEEARGAVYVLFMRGDGSVRDYRKISSRRGDFTGELAPGDRFGSALASPGDLDGDLVPDLVVSAPAIREPFPFKPGKLWVLFLERDGSVRAQQEISGSAGGFGGLLGAEDGFGSALAPVGDLDGNGVTDLVAGASGDRGAGGPSDHQGALWFLFLNADGTVAREQKVGALDGGFKGVLGANDLFGSALAALGDLDGDGITELAAGAQHASSAAGTVWILFPNADGTIRAQREVGASGFEGLLDAGDRFGSALSALGDRDGDGKAELAVGAPFDDDGGFDRGAVWTLALDADGSVLAASKTSDREGGFTGVLRDMDGFGSALAAFDLDLDGARDLCVGAAGNPGRSSTTELEVGAAWFLFADALGAIRSHAKIDFDEPALLGTLDDGDWFGSSVASLGDLDGDGTTEVAVGAVFDDGAGEDRGAVWVLSLDEAGTVQRHLRIGSRESGMTSALRNFDHFGASVAALEDLDGDGRRELAVGAPGDDDGLPGLERGAVWILFLRSDGTVRAAQKISAIAGGFGGPLNPFDHFGSSLAGIGDVDGDGFGDLAVGAPDDDAGGAVFANRGAVWILSLTASGTVAAERELDAATVGFGPLDVGDRFGASLASPGDLDRDGRVELAAGAPGDDDGGSDRGALWILFPDADGTVGASQKISSLAGAFGGVLENRAGFGRAVSAIGDLDGDGVDDLAVAAAPAFPSTDDSHVWLLFLARDGRVGPERRLDASLPGLAGADAETFGLGLARIGDLDRDGLFELAVGVPGSDIGGPGHGALWVLALDGVGRLGFEHGDDLVTPLANGEALVNGAQFGRVASVQASGANLGAAIFDSTPGGPNDGGPDGDLLVDRGNLLIAQDSLAPTQSVPGFFDLPGDDPDPSTFSFAFRRSVEPLSLDLADIDLAPGDTASVTLVDVRGRVRVYRIPAGWTGDRLLDGVSGIARLDLTTLEPQPGLAASALAVEDPSFTPERVCKIVVELSGSGALDDLRFDPHPAPRAIRTR